ncbi:hypothetical protein Acor_21660 [Acrocarpospora corrugata]|uniref:Uncharacterized protein n=1 Tax=Acrocarpospora corrugata TaxID=35763 RepID=A0A5M3VYE7_9ACTN|nr:hypothetical protein [Acrocarpospora corrugata]GES00103.1 hypothetical protein Acor_21660 [Acrocarpospora corrugata]
MFKKIAVTGAILTAACGASLIAAPAHADSWTDNWSVNRDSAQSGNNFGWVVARNAGSGRSTNVNNINGIAATATGGSVTVTYIFH